MGIYSVHFGAAIGGLVRGVQMIFKAQGASQRVFQLIDRTPQIPTHGGLCLQAIRGDVRFESVDFSYPSRPDVPVLKDLCLSAPANSTTALVGASGVGKSTVVALLARFYDPCSGCVFLDGTDLRTLNPAWLRRQIAMVQQEPTLFACSIRENLCYARSAALVAPEAAHAVPQAELQRACEQANACDFIEAFPEGYDTLVGERGVRLSGGEKQRCAIARALLADPRILLLDEATSALDARSEHLVQEALDRLMHARSVFVVAHRLSTVQN